MMEYLDLALDYLKDHRLLAASIAFLFIILLIRNFWFIIKLIVILAIAVIVVLFALSFVGDYVKKKKDLLKPEENSSLMEPIKSDTAQLHHHLTFS
jgi:hypothetical protein